jgi:hypothetical protein
MPAGRPLKYQSIEELQAAIDDYFTSTPEKDWTWTGLALHLDTSRETLREYKERPEYVDSLKKALLKVEGSYEKDLKRDGKAGTIFALKNFGWHDRQEIKHELPANFLNIDPLADAPSDNSPSKDSQP